MQDHREVGYNVLYFTPYSTEAAWIRLYPDEHVTNTISARLTATDPLPIPSRSSLMSTSPTSETPPSHNSLSKYPVDSTTVFIAMMHQTLQQNSIFYGTPPNPPRWYNRQQLPHHTNLITPPFQSRIGRHPLLPSSSHKLQHTSQKRFTRACKTGQ